MNTSGAARRQRGRVDLFASAANDPRVRRPIDWIRSLVALSTLVVFAVLGHLGAELDADLSNVLIEFPPFLDIVWHITFWLGLAWSAVLLGFAAFGRRPLLALELVGAGALAIVVCAVVSALVTDDASRVFTGMLDTDGPPIFPPAALAVTSAAISTALPYLTLPFRRFGRSLVVAQIAGALFLGVTVASGAIASLAVGSLAGSAFHLMVGSPGGIPTVGRVGEALRQLGLDVSGLTQARLRHDGVALLDGHDDMGPVIVKVYGRDAWDAELLASMWLHLWYRESRRSTRLKGSELVEHEGFMSFLASRAGARVPEVVTAAQSGKGDALIVTRPAGRPLDVDDITLTTEQIDSLWEQLAILHAAGMAHHRIELDRVNRLSDRSACFGDMSSLSVLATEADQRRDRAQLLGLATLTAGEDAAVASARKSLGDGRVAHLLPYLQEAALPPSVHAALNEQHVELDDVRERLTETLGAPTFDLVKLRRVTWGSVFNVTLLTVAAYTIIGMFGGIDFEEFADALNDANWWWLLFALVLGQTPRVAAAFSTIGSTTHPLPLGPTTGLQFATCYVNLTVPSSAGRVAMTTRYFQRFGIPASTALAAGFIDTLSQTVIQISLFLLVFFASDVDLGLSFDPDELSGFATIVMIVLAALVVVVLLVILVPSVRKRIATPFRHLQDALDVFRMPGKVLDLIGGNLGSEILFAMTLAVVTRAYGYELPLSTFILINTIVSLFSSVIPVPGGIGVTEAGLTWGLTAAGIPEDTAFAVALTHRFITFYLPPIWGVMSYRWLIKHRFL
jgi:uncharacterized membrane protein YbhN (UPF0104 family)